MSNPKDVKRPFSEPELHEPKVGLKKVSGQKSMFDGRPKTSSQQDFQEKIQQVEDRKTGYKQKAADLFMQFTKSMNDKTLAQNRNILSRDSEKEMLQEMIQLAMDINNDPNEVDQMGSLTWITCLFKTCLAQRDKINELEYSLVSLSKKINSQEFSSFIEDFIEDLIDKKVSKAFDTNDR